MLITRPKNCPICGDEGDLRNGKGHDLRFGSYVYVSCTPCAVTYKMIFPDPILNQRASPLLMLREIQKVRGLVKEV